jgi:hypothetical protein
VSQYRSSKNSCRDMRSLTSVSRLSLTGLDHQKFLAEGQSVICDFSLAIACEELQVVAIVQAVRGRQCANSNDRKILSWSQRKQGKAPVGLASDLSLHAMYCNPRPYNSHSYLDTHLSTLSLSYSKLSSYSIYTHDSANAPNLYLPLGGSCEGC